MNAPGRTLVVRRGGLGDTLLMAPVLRALARASPGAAIDFAGVREFAAVLAHWRLCAGALSSEDFPAWRGAALAERLRAYALVVADDPAFAAVAGPECRVMCFEPRPRPGSRQPLPLQIAAQLGVAVDWPRDAWMGAVRCNPDGSVVLAPGSGGRTKCWPRAQWLELAGALAARGTPVGIVVGPTELERDDPRRWPWPVAASFVVTPDVVELATTIERARAFVGNDSGPTHLAAMAGVPTVALFGSSDPEVFGPNGPQVEIVLAPERRLKALSVATVGATLRRIGVP